MLSLCQFFSHAELGWTFEEAALSAPWPAFRRFDSPLRRRSKFWKFGEKYEEFRRKLKRENKNSSFGHREMKTRDFAYFRFFFKFGSFTDFSSEPKRNLRFLSKSNQNSVWWFQVSFEQFWGCRWLGGAQWICLGFSEFFSDFHQKSPSHQHPLNSSETCLKPTVGVLTHFWRKSKVDSLYGPSPTDPEFTSLPS